MSHPTIHPLFQGPYRPLVEPSFSGTPRLVAGLAVLFAAYRGRGYVVFTFPSYLGRYVLASIILDCPEISGDYYRTSYYEVMAKKKSLTLFDRLRAAIKRDSRTPYAIAKDAGVSRIMLSRFIHGKSITVETFEKIAKAVKLGLGE